MSSQQTCVLKARCLVLSPAFPPPCHSLGTEPGLFQSPRKLELAASCWQGVPSRLLVLLPKKGGVGEEREVDYTQRGSALLFPFLVTEGENELRGGPRGIGKSIIHDS